MNPSNQAYQTQDGIAFSVQVEYVRHECIITDEALQKLSSWNKPAGSEVNSLAIFHAYEAKISGIARRLVSAGVKGVPLRLTAASVPGSAQPA